MLKFNIHDRVRSIKKQSTVGTVTGVSSHLDNNENELITVLVDGFAAPRQFRPDELEHVPAESQSPDQPIDQSPNAPPAITQPNPAGQLYCRMPVMIVFGGDQTQDCGRPAAFVITVEILGVKIMMERPMCVTCGQSFVQTGVKLAAQPIGQIVAMPANAIAGMKNQN